MKSGSKRGVHMVARILRSFLCRTLRSKDVVSMLGGDALLSNATLKRRLLNLKRPTARSTTLTYFDSSWFEQVYQPSNTRLSIDTLFMIKQSPISLKELATQFLR